MRLGTRSFWPIWSYWPFGPVHFPAVPQPLPLEAVWNISSLVWAKPIEVSKHPFKIVTTSWRSLALHANTNLLSHFCCFHWDRKVKAHHPPIHNAYLHRMICKLTKMLHLRCVILYKCPDVLAAVLGVREPLPTYTENIRMFVNDHPCWGEGQEKFNSGPTSSQKRADSHLTRGPVYKLPPSIVDLSVFPREEGQIHNRPGAWVAFINWFAGDLWVGPFRMMRWGDRWEMKHHHTAGHSQWWPLSDVSLEIQQTETDRWRRGRIAHGHPKRSWECNLANRGKQTPTKILQAPADFVSSPTRRSMGTVASQTTDKGPI